MANAAYTSQAFLIQKPACNEEWLLIIKRLSGWPRASQVRLSIQAGYGVRWHSAFALAPFDRVGGRQLGWQAIWLEHRLNRRQCATREIIIYKDLNVQA